MELNFKEIRIRNFLSFGNVEEIIPLNKCLYQVIVGMNKDKSDSNTDRNGVGKAQPLYSPILTPNGWKTMGDMKVGSSVITPKGKVAKVTDIFPQGKIDVYRIYFSDGRYTDCCENHLWKIWTGRKTSNNGKYEYQIWKTKDIIEHFNLNLKSFKKNIYVPLVENIDIYETRDFVISPYIMGVLLGEGCMHRCSFTSMDEEIVNKVQKELMENYDFTIYKKKNCKDKQYDIVKTNKNNGNVNIYKQELKRYGLFDSNSYNKFIPEDYKKCSLQQKMELLRGLFDTDGSAGKHKNIEISFSSKQLALDVQELLWSIGAVCRITERIPFYYNKNGEKIYSKNKSYRLHIRIKKPDELFNSSRKKNLCAQYQYEDTLRNKIIKVEKIGQEECQCIIINDDEHLYVTDNYIVTHNSSIFEAIHYALFGKSIGNKITLGNLINNINKKNMVVTLIFEKNGVEYTIKRGRSPNILMFMKNDEEINVNESQGDSRETQVEIEKVLGMNEDVYNQIVCLSCKVPIFNDQTTANQKNIIEHILGINIISEKIDALKALIKETKNEFNNKQFEYNTIKTQNDNLMQSINKQIVDMNTAKEKWENEIKQQINNVENAISQMKLIDIDTEIKNFQLLENYLTQEGVNQQNQQLKDSLNKQIQEKDIFIKNYQIRIAELMKYDFVAERQNILYNEQLNKERIAYDIEENKYKTIKNFKEQNLDTNFKRIVNEIEKKETELANIKEDVCPTCGQPMRVEEVNKLKESKKEEIIQLQNELHRIDMEILEANHTISLFVPKVFEFKSVSFNDMNSLLEKENELNQLKLQLENIVKEKNDLIEQENKIVIVDLGIKPQTHYSNIQEALQHQATLESLGITLNSLQKQLLTNPFEQQEKSIEELKKNIQVLDDAPIKQVQDDLNHQEVLLKLLNSPSSFIRTTILEKSLEFLNSKIMQYLAQLGSLHIVSFNSDMSLTIEYMGIQYGYVSTGEMGRISLALTLAFRDVWETLNNCKINLFAMDEVIDRIGLDTAGVEMTVQALQTKEDKNVMLVTHNDTLINQAPHLMTLVKENGFTEILK